ncbi:Rft-1-domain-containing protein [Gautieria morchelliformis]|nr:Rft-1-domain-containing protein [Gautieria morchelliformis]
MAPPVKTPLAQPANLLATSVSSASSLVLLQLFSRLFTFTLNQALVRLASPQTFGTAAIQFELLLSTILFLCREGVRNALLRAHPLTKSRRADSSTDLVANISYLPVILGIPIAIIAAVLYVTASSSSTTSQPYFRVSVALYALAAFLELASEPLYIRAQNDLRFNVRVRAEGSAIVSKTILTFVILVAAPSKWALVAFAVGQATYGFVTLVSYLRAYGRHGSFRLRKVQVSTHNSAYFDTELLHLSGAMTAQSVVKHFLTEGDKFLISYLSPLADQGGYALASNYGSLVARILFQPIEETSRVFFSKTLSSSSPTRADLSTAAHILLSLLLLFTHLLLLLATFGPPYLPLAISILIPPRYHATSAPMILRTYVYYIPTMAFNGLLEAFLASTSSPADLRTQSRWMVLFSITFIVTAVTLSRFLSWGDAGLVWANVANLGLRALYAWNFTRRFYVQRGAGELVRWQRTMPPLPVFGIFVVAAAVTRWSAKAHHDLPISSQLGHITIGIACIMGCLSACFIFERALFRELIAIMRRNK